MAALSWYSRQSATFPSRTRSTPMNGAEARCPVVVTTPPSSYSTTITSGSAVSWTATVRHSSNRAGNAARPAEVAVVVRPHLVPLAVAERDLAAHRRDPGGVRREADRRVTARLFWGRVLVVVRPVEQVGTAHEEREVRTCLPRDAAPVLPQTRAARAVERHDDELRRMCGGTPRLRLRLRPGVRDRRRHPARMRRAADVEQRARQNGDRGNGEQPAHPSIVASSTSEAVQARCT